MQCYLISSEHNLEVVTIFARACTYCGEDNRLGTKLCLLQNACDPGLKSWGSKGLSFPCYFSTSPHPSVHGYVNLS